MRLAARLERGMSYDRRAATRSAVRVGAGLYDNVRPSFDIVVIDLSTDGCGITTGLELEPGSRVWLKLPGLESWACKVVWCGDGRAGLSFDNPLHQGVLDRFR
jgi:hypothetical protein